MYISPLTVQPSRATNAIGRNIGLDVALGFMRMFHFRKSGPGAASAVNGGGLRMRVFDPFVCDLFGLLINLVNEHHREGFFFCARAIVLAVLLHLTRFQLDRAG